MPKPSFEDKRRLEAKENRLQEMRMTSKMKRDVTVAVSAQGFYCTGIMCDVIQVGVSEGRIMDAVFLILLSKFIKRFDFKYLFLRYIYHIMDSHPFHDLF